MTEEISVKVTDYNCSNVNPSPIKIPKDGELLEEFLSPRKLQTLTGVDNLETVEYLEMRVNTEQMSLGNFGMYLPNLSQLRLSGSIIPSIRDLGTSLFNLQVLWMPQCALYCLDGLVTMASIRELYLSYNDIDDISPCGMLENLEILDLEGNFISDHTQLHYLSMCAALSRLNLEGNPVLKDRTFQDFRILIQEILPQLQYLNDFELSTSLDPANDGDNILDSTITDSTQMHTNNGDTNENHDPEFEKHWAFINSVLQESGLLASAPLTHSENTTLSDDSSHLPSTSTAPHTAASFSRDSGRFSLTSSRGTLSYRPFTTRGNRPTTSGLFSSPRHFMLDNDAPLPIYDNMGGNGTVARRPHTADFYSNNSRPNTGASSGNDSLLDEDRDSHRDIESHLTAGKPVCGSLARSLVKRTISKPLPRQLDSPRTNDNAPDADSIRRPKTAVIATRNKINSEEGFSDEKCDEILQELSQWRLNYEKTRSTIEARRSPQVLTLESSENHVEPANTTKRPSTATPLKPSTKTSETQPLSTRKSSQSSIKSTSKIQLNPLKSPKPTPQPSINSSNQNLTNSSTNHNTPTSNPVANQQLSRIRRQLLQAGAVSTNLTPSKPQLKKA